MQRIYRFEVVEERYRGPENALLRARDSAFGSVVTLCQWTPRLPVPAAEATLAAAAESLHPAEVFTDGSSFYLAAPDDSAAASALAQLRSLGWFQGEWPGLIATPETAAAAAPAHPAPGRNRLGIFALVGLAFAAGIVVTALLSRKPEPQPATAPPPSPQPTFSQPLVQAPVPQSAPPQPAPIQPPPIRKPAQVPASLLLNAALRNWRSAMLAQDSDRLADCYAPTVEQYFRKGTLSRDTVRDLIRGFMNAWPQVTQYELSAVAWGAVLQNRAAVTFHKSWDSWNAAHSREFAGAERERLTFAKIGAAWKIVREEELRIDWVKTH